MAKDKTGAAALTPDLLPKRGRGRPPSGSALTLAERQARFRAARKQAGVCPCCGQALPDRQE